jgi:hypothetical protein
LSATNHGPTDVTLHSAGITILQRWPWQSPQHALVNPINNINTPELGVGPFGGGLPRTLKVGEGHSLYFPHGAQSFARAHLGRVGFSDSFGRFHRARKFDLRKEKAALDETFAGTLYKGLPPPPAQNS